MILRSFNFLVQALDLELRGLGQRLEILYLCHHLFELFRTFFKRLAVELELLSNFWAGLLC